MKRFNISSDWREYTLYIVYGDTERCLGMNERPLVIFKQLDKEGKKPTFMLRKASNACRGSCEYERRDRRFRTFGVTS